MTFIGMMLSMKVQAADMPANPVDKPGYTLDYADEFNGDSLDKSKWTDYYLPHWSKNPENARNGTWIIIEFGSQIKDTTRMRRKNIY